MKRFVQIDRDTAYLLPPSVQEWLPEDHLARFVVETVEQLDLSELKRQYAGRGVAAYHPAMLLALLIYGYATGGSPAAISSGRPTTRWPFATSPPTPIPTTTRSRPSAALPDANRSAVRAGAGLAREMKLLKLGNVALDGTKIEGQRRASTGRCQLGACQAASKRSCRRKCEQLLAWPSRPTARRARRDGRAGGDRAA